MFNPVPRSPETWTRVEVNIWLRERVREYGLDPDLPNRFPMNGKGLCMLDKEDFRQRAPDTGDVLYNSLRCLAFATLPTSPLKQSLAYGTSNFRVPESYEDSEASLAFCAGYLESTQQPRLFPIPFDHHGLLEMSEDEPLNLKVTKHSPMSRTRTFDSMTRLSLVDSLNQERKSVGFETAARHRYFNNNNNNNGLRYVDSFPPVDPVQLMPSSLLSQSPSTPSSLSPHLCRSPGRRSTPSSSPVGSGPTQVLLRCPHLTSRGVRLSPHLTSLASFSSAVKRDVIDDASSAMTSTQNYSTMTYALEEKHKSFTSETDFQPIQVSTTTETNTLQLHRKMDLNLSTSDRLLWKFLAELLERNRTKCVAWEDRQRLTFQIVDPNELAELWGEEKCRPGMTYEKLSRALRYYYKMNILEKVPGKRLTYKFVTSPQFIKKGKRGAKPGVPHKRKDGSKPAPPPPSNLSAEECSAKPARLYDST